MSSCVWPCVVSHRFDLFFSFECLYFLSILFISSVLLIILHVVETAEQKNPCAHAEWGVLPRGDTQPSHRLGAQPARQLRLLRNFCSDLPEWIRHIDTEPSYSCDAELDDELIGEALSSPQFTKEREAPANVRQTYHSHEESLLPSQSLSVGHVRTGDPCTNRVQICLKKRKSSRDLENERTRTLLERQKEQFLAEVRSEIQKRELQAERDRRRIQEINWNYWFSANGRVWPIQARSITTSRRAIRTKSGSSWNSYQEYARHGRIAEKSRVNGPGTFKKKIDWRPKHKLWSWEPEFRNYRMKSICMNDSRDFKDSESVRSGPSHVPNQPALLPPCRDPGGLLSRNNQPPDIWNSQGTSGNVFANPPSVFFVTFSRRIQSLDF